MKKIHYAWAVCAACVLLMFCNIGLCSNLITVYLPFIEETGISGGLGSAIITVRCLFAFITSGFEHSIANMTLFTVALLQPVHEAVTVGGFFYNLIIVNLGNIVGGALFVAVPYYIAGRKDK